MTLSIEVLSYTDEKLDKISFQPEDYYLNQINFFHRNIQNNNKGLEAGIKERVILMEKIYLNAKNK
jgi:hypothetical protein